MLCISKLWRDVDWVVQWYSYWHVVSAATSVGYLGGVQHPTKANSSKYEWVLNEGLYPLGSA